MTTHSKTQAEDWARRLYHEAVDRKDAAGFAAVFAEDGTLRFGNEPMLTGRAAIETAIAAFFTAMESLEHEFVAIFRDDETLFLEARVTYQRHDGKVVTVPAMTVFEMNEEFLARSCRVYVDLAPLFAAS